MSVESVAIIVSREQKSEVLIRLRGCSGPSALLLFACNKISGGHKNLSPYEAISFFRSILFSGGSLHYPSYCSTVVFIDTDSNITKISVYLLHTMLLYFVIFYFGDCKKCQIKITAKYFTVDID